jgi:hypothetical protein
MVEHRCTLGVSRVVQLETTVESEPVDEICSHPTTDCVGRFEDCHLDPVILKVDRRGETCQSRPHDNRLGALRDCHRQAPLWITLVVFIVIWRTVLGMTDDEWPPPWGQQPVPLPMPRQSLPGVMGLDWDDEGVRTQRPERLLQWLSTTSKQDWMHDPKVRIAAGGAAAVVLLLLLVFV